MKMSEAFPSKYLSSPDLNGQTIREVISRVEEGVHLGDDTKPVLHFRGGTKALYSNITNCKTIAVEIAKVQGITDPRDVDVQDFVGTTVDLFTVKTQNQRGEIVDGLRLSVVGLPQNLATAATTPMQPPQEEPPAHTDADEVPF